MGKDFTSWTKWVLLSFCIGLCSFIEHQLLLCKRVFFYHATYGRFHRLLDIFVLMWRCQREKECQEKQVEKKEYSWAVWGKISLLQRCSGFLWTWSCIAEWWLMMAEANVTATLCLYRDCQTPPPAGQGCKFTLPTVEQTAFLKLSKLNPFEIMTQL